MRRLAVVLLALLSLPASAQGRSPFLWSTKSILEIAAGLTDAGRFGAPGWATASLPTCNAANERAIAYDLTTNTLKFCNGSAWGAIAGGGDALTTNPLSQFAATTSAQFAGVISDETGTGVVVLATSPTLVTPTLGVAAATSINKVALTAPATAATLTIADGKTLTASNTLTLTGTDSTSFAFPATSGTVATLNTANTFTAAGQLISPATDAIGLTLRAHVTNTADLLLIQKSNNDDILKITANGSIVSEGTADLNELTLAFADAAADVTVTVPATTGTVALTADKLSAFAATTSAELAGVLSDETGSGVAVFGTSPTLTTPVLGVAAATSINKVAITAPATGSTLTIAEGKTLTASNTLTFTGTDATSFAFPAASTTVAGLGTAQAFTGANDFGGGGLEIPNSITLPATCTVGQVYQDTDATAASQFYACTALNTWTAQGAAGAGDVVGPASSVDNSLPRFDGLTGKIIQGYTSGSPTCTDAGACTFSGTTLSGNTTVSTMFLTANAIIAFVDSGQGALKASTTLTPDAGVWHTGTAARSMHVAEYADEAYDFQNGPCGTSACTDPTVIVHSSTQNTTDYLGHAAYGFAGRAQKALTDSAATSIVRIPVASGAMAGGEIRYTIVASDGTDHQARYGFVRYSIVNKAGTETCSLSSVAGTTDASVSELEDGSGSGAISAGTLTYAVTCDATPANAVDIQVNAVSSLTETSLLAYYRVDHVGPGEPARQ